MTYDKDAKYVLARSVNEDGLEFTDITGRRSNTAEAAWAYDYGKGRSRVRENAKKRREVALARDVALHVGGSV